MTYGILMSLLFAAVLEAGGNATVRLGLHAFGVRRVVLLGVGALILFAYGCVVNTPQWDFGRLIGVYIVFFFLVAQAIAWLVFNQAPSVNVWLGGALIVVGGLVMSAGAR